MYYYQYETKLERARRYERQGYRLRREIARDEVNEAMSQAVVEVMTLAHLRAAALSSIF